MRAAIVSVLAALALGVAACGGGSSSTSASRHSAASASAPAPATPIHVSRTDPLIAAAGDIACPRSYGVSAVECHQAVTALIVGRLRPAAVLAVGDDQYETGSLMDFQSAYAASWGSLSPAAPRLRRRRSR